MSKVYELKKSSEYSNLIEIYDNVDNTFIKKYWEWKIIEFKNYKEIGFKLYKNQDGIKNFKSDFFIVSGSFIIFSEKAINVLKNILVETGQIIPIKTESKRKKFYGFYPNKNIYDDYIINLNKSEWHQAEKGKMFYKVILNKKYPKDDYLFVLFDEPMTVYITDKFKEIIEKNDLKGFDFSREIKISD